MNQFVGFRSGLREVTDHADQCPMLLEPDEFPRQDSESWCLWRLLD